MAWCGAASHLNVRATVALLALKLTVVLVLLAAVTRRRAFRGFALNDDLWWCLPAWNLPNHTSETLDFERSLLPLTTWLSGSIESS